eukprot:69043_1
MAVQLFVQCEYCRIMNIKGTNKCTACHTSLLSISTPLKLKWKLPSISNYEKNCLCYGYVRQNYNKFITKAIIQLFAQYFTNDPYTLDDIKNTIKKKTFYSPVFCISGSKWQFEIRISCGMLSINEISYVVKMLSFPSNISHMLTSCQLQLNNIHKTLKIKQRFDSSHNSFSNF